MAAEADGMGGFYSFILDDNGHVWELRSPVNAGEGEYHKLEGLHDIVNLAPLGAVRRDGKVFTWDLSRDYPDGGFTTPRMVKGIDHAVAIDSLRGSFLALLSDGTLVQWWGEPSSSHRQSPEAVAGISGVVQMSWSGDGGVVLTRDGNVLGWGHNYFGELGQDHRGRNEFIRSNEAQFLYGGGDAKQVLSVGFLTLVLRKDGHVMYWGSVPRPDSKVELSGTVDEIDDVVGLYRDSVGSLFYTRRDGSVWWVVPPDPRHPLSICAGEIDPYKDRACKIKGITVPVISASGAPVLLVGADHSLWEGNETIARKIELPE